MDRPACPGWQALQRRIAELEAKVERRTRLLEQQQRAGKGQATPFAEAQRQSPGPEQIDEIHEAPLPDRCPDCGGPFDETHIAQQVQVEIVPPFVQTPIPVANE